jgi:hypothetical protein
MLEALDNKTPLSLPEALRREVEEIESIGGLNHLKEILTEVKERDCLLTSRYDSLSEMSEAEFEFENKVGRSAMYLETVHSHRRLHHRLTFITLLLLCSIPHAGGTAT